MNAPHYEDRNYANQWSNHRHEGPNQKSRKLLQKVFKIEGGNAKADGIKVFKRYFYTFRLSQATNGCHFCYPGLVEIPSLSLYS